MSLPPSFNDPEEYFERSLSFFKEYQYLFKFPNTDILINKIIDNLEAEIDDIDVFDSNFELPSLDDRYVQTFLHKLENIKTEYEVVDDSQGSFDLGNFPLSPKKRHEIIHLGDEIKSISEASGCKIVVDFGSGLGYLDQYLHQTTGLKVLGLECDASHHAGANIRQEKYHKKSTEHVKYVCHTVTKGSDEDIRNFVKERFPTNENLCITGLHACADLTIDSMNLFLKMPESKAMILMSCCYHKMKQKTNSRFRNFPLSQCLKKMFDKQEGREFLGIPFLRLAAQAPLRIKENFEKVVFNLLSRAVLEVYAHKHNVTIQRNNRKAVKVETNENDFESYLERAKTGFTIKRKTTECELSARKTTEKHHLDLEELRIIWKKYSVPRNMKKTGIYVLLQNELQPVIENFIFYDRLLYFKENGINTCEVKRIFNVNISPRCLALIAYK